MVLSRSMLDPAAASWTATHRAVGRAVADAVGLTAGPSAPEGPAEVDWPRFAELVAGHAVAPLVRRSAWLAAQPVPTAVDSRLHVLARRGASASLRNLAALGEITAVSERAGIDVVVLDGPALAAWAYGDPLARQGSTLQLLVEPAHVAAAARLLTGLDFEVIGPAVAADADVPAGDAELTFVRGSTFVDLRWRLFANAALLPLDLSDPRQRLRVDVGGLTVTTLAREPAWWYLAVHGTHRRWSCLQWLADVAAVLRVTPGLAAPAALDRAAAAGVDRCVGTGLRLAAEVLGLPLPPEAAAWVARRPGVARLADQSRRYLVATERDTGGPAPARLVERASFALGMRPDARYRRAIVRLAVVQGAHDHLAPLADWRWRAARAARSLVRSIG